MAVRYRACRAPSSSSCIARRRDLGGQSLKNQTSKEECLFSAPSIRSRRECLTARILILETYRLLASPATNRRFANGHHGKVQVPSRPPRNEDRPFVRLRRPECGSAFCARGSYAETSGQVLYCTADVCRSGDEPAQGLRAGPGIREDAVSQGAMAPSGLRNSALGEGGRFFVWAGRDEGV